MEVSRGVSPKVVVKAWACQLGLLQGNPLQLTPFLLFVDTVFPINYDFCAGTASQIDG